MPDYIVRISTTKAEESIVTERLVRAPNKASAISHVVESMVAISVAETEDIIRLAGAGVKLETAA